MVHRDLATGMSPAGPAASVPVMAELFHITERAVWLEAFRPSDHRR
jgi:hypothetical protein